MRSRLYEVFLLKSIESDEHMIKEKNESSEILKFCSKDCEVLLRKKLKSFCRKEDFSLHQNPYKLLQKDEARNPDLLLAMHDRETFSGELTKNRP